MKKRLLTSWLIAALCALGLGTAAQAADYYWIGGTEGNWADGANWSLTEGGAAAGEYPDSYDDDNATFPAGASFKVASAIKVNTITLKGDLTIDGDSQKASIFVRTINGADYTLICTNGVLFDHTNFTSKCYPKVRFESSTTEHRFNTTGGAYDFELHGNVSGDGTVFSYDRSNGAAVKFYGTDNSGFTGYFHYGNRASYTHRCDVYFKDGGATSANARWCFHGYENKNYQFGTNNETYRFGSLETSCLWMNGAIGVTLEIGHRDDVDSYIYGNMGNANSSNGVVKVGNGLLKIDNTNVHHIEAQAGTVLVNTAAAVPYGWLKFTGGTVQATNDLSAVIMDSTSPITFDDEGMNNAWNTALAASNVGGFTKLGNGTLTLAEKPLYTGKTTISAGELVVPTGTTLGALEVAEEAMLTLASVEEPLVLTGAVSGKLPLKLQGITTVGDYVFLKAPTGNLTAANLDLSIKGDYIATVTTTEDGAGNTIFKATVEELPNITDAAQWYKFDGNLEPVEGTQELTFEGGTNGSTFVETGMTEAGQAIVLDKTTDVLPYASNAAYTTGNSDTWSIACVATTGTPRDGCIWSVGNGSDYRYALKYTKDGRLSLVYLYKNEDTDTEIIGTDLGSNNLVYHSFVVVRFSNEKFALYVDGALKASTEAAGNKKISGTVIGLGRAYPRDSVLKYVNDGVRLADLRIFKRELTAKQIAYYAEKNPSTTIKPTDTTFTWTGNAGDGLWTTPGNWKYAGAASGLVPGANDAVSFTGDATVILDEAKTVKSLAQTAGTLTLSFEGSAIKAGTALTITGTKPVSLDVGSADNRYSFSYANGKITAAYADSIYVWQLSTREGEWTNAVNWKVNGTTATTAPTATDRVLIEKDTIIDTTGDCYGSNITVCASVTLKGAGPLRFAEIDGSNDASLSLDGTQLRPNTPANTDAYVNVPIEIAGGHSATFISGPASSYKRLAFTKPITGSGSLYTTQPDRNNVYSGIRLEGDMSGFSGSVTIQADNDGSGIQLRISDQLSSASSSQSARWDFYTNVLSCKHWPGKNYDIYDKNTLLYEANSIYRFGSLRMLLPGSPSRIAADGVIMQVGALDEASWIYGDWKDPANAPTLEWVAKSATFTNLAANASTIILSGGGNVMLPVTNYYPQAITFTDKGGTLAFGDDYGFWGAYGRSELRKRITNSTAQVALDFGKDYTFSTTFLDASNTGGYRKIGTGTIGFKIQGYSGLTTVEEGRLALDQGTVLDGGLEVTGTDAKVVITNMTGITIGEPLLTWTKDTAAKKLSIANFEIGTEVKVYMLVKIEDVGEDQQALIIEANPAYAYTWTDATGNHLWSDPANWTVGGEVAEAAPTAVFPVTIPASSTIIVDLDQEFGSLTIGRNVTIMVGFTGENQTYTIPAALKGKVSFKGRGPYEVTVGDDTVATGARIASTFIWCNGTGNGVWETSGNWKMGDIVVPEIPKLAGDIPTVKTESTIALTSTPNHSNVVVSAALTLRDNILYTHHLSGGGVVTLDPGAGLRAPNEDIAIDNSLVINGTEENPNLIGTTIPSKDDSNSNNLTFGSGVTISGDGYVTFVGNRIQCALPDFSDFTGHVTLSNDLSTRANYHIAQQDGTIDYSKSVWEVHNSSAKENPFVTYLSEGLLLKFGSLSGSINQGYGSTHNISKVTFEVGALGLDDTLGGTWVRNSDRVAEASDLRKVGSGTLNFSVSYVKNIEVAGGVLNLTNEATFGNDHGSPVTKLSFVNYEGETGGTVTLGTAVTNIDLSAWIYDSTAPIRFNDQDRNYTWATALDASNDGGLIKTGTGTLTLTQPVKMTNGVWGVKAGKVIVPQSGFKTEWVAPYTTCTANGSNYELTYKSSAQLAIEAGEGAVSEGVVDAASGASYDPGDYIANGRTITIKAKISDDDYYKNLKIMVISGTSTNTLTTSTSEPGFYSASYTLTDAVCGPDKVLTVAFSAAQRTLATITEKFSASGFGEIFYTYGTQTNRYVNAEEGSMHIDMAETNQPFYVHFTVKTGFRLREIQGTDWDGDTTAMSYACKVNPLILDGDPALYIKLQSLEPYYVTVPDVANATVAVAIPDPLDCGETNRIENATVYTVYLDAHLIVDYTAADGSWYLDGTSHFDYEKIGGTFTVPAPTAKVAGITIGGKGYKDFRAARAAFKAGDTILIANDYAFEGWGAGASVAIPADVTIDLGGNTYDVSLSVVTNHTVTITNGTLRTSGQPTVQVMSGTAILSALTVEATDAVALYICEGGAAQLTNGSTLTSTGEGEAVSVDQNAKFTADTGTTITSKGFAAVYQDVGSVVTLNGELNGDYAVYVDGGKLVMTNATLGANTTDAIIYSDHSLEVPDVAITNTLVGVFQIFREYEEDPLYELADSGKGYWSLVLSDDQSGAKLALSLAAPLRFATAAGATANAANVTVEPTEEVEDALEMAAEEKGTSLEEEKAAYAKLFTVSASGATVAATLDAAAVQETLDAGVGEVLSEVITVTSDGEASALIEVTAQPGLYYGLAASATLEGLAAEKPTLTRATGTKVELSVDHFPTSGFYMLKVSATKEQ